MTSSSFLSSLLLEQQTLTAVEKFAGSQPHGLEARPGIYRDLLPSSELKPGQQYAFEVNLDHCSGCKACVSACHSLNGLDTHETWRDVGLLVGGTSEAPVRQHVTTACHHCLEPACMIGCPVNAYEKDASTGIVKHLDDQCIGCQYCTLACPYEVPKYHAAKGIVRKCDMCSARLAIGEAPACVQACPHQAISIRIVDRQQVVDDAETVNWLPGAPDPQITLPTTTFKSRRVLPRNTLPVDYHQVNPHHPHFPLIVMLVLTQMSVGALAVGLLLEPITGAPPPPGLLPRHAAVALVLGLLAMAVSVLHLGRPRYAYRAMLGVTHSWLSREIIAFGAFAKLAIAYAAAAWWLPTFAPDWIGWLPHLGWAAVIAGAVGIVCSAMVYVFTQRECWSWERTLTRFTLSAALSGIAAAWLCLLIGGAEATPEVHRYIEKGAPALCRLLIGVALVKLSWEVGLFRHLAIRRNTALKRSARLMIGPLSHFTMARWSAGLLGGLVMPLLLLHNMTHQRTALAPIVALLVAACLLGELLERYLFFASAAAPRMPGELH
jgi:formate dehydrogenase iron-sulfur subunit